MLVPKDFNLSNVILSVIFAKQQRRIRYMPITFRPRQGGVKYFFLGYFQGRKISVGKWFLLGWAFIRGIAAGQYGSAFFILSTAYLSERNMGRQRPMGHKACFVLCRRF